MRGPVPGRPVGGAVPWAPPVGEMPSRGDRGRADPLDVGPLATARARGALPRRARRRSTATWACPSRRSRPRRDVPDHRGRRRRVARRLVRHGDGSRGTQLPWAVSWVVDHLGEFGAAFRGEMERKRFEFTLEDYLWARRRRFRYTAGTSMRFSARTRCSCARPTVLRGLAGRRDAPRDWPRRRHRGVSHGGRSST